MSLLSQVQTVAPVGPIYHYTSQAGLIGILSKREIWASDINFLSDAAEISYPLESVRQRLSTQRQYVSGDRQWLVDELKEIIHVGTLANLFVVSFSEEPDLLSQWRAYCPSSGGFSIGINHQDIGSALNTQGFRLVKCVYEETIHEQLIDQYVQDSLEAIQSTELDASAPSVQLVELAKRFVEIAVVMKHPSFYEEKEWRAVSSIPDITHPQIEFRVGQSFFVPYFRLQLQDDRKNWPFARIIVGPTPHPTLSKRAIALLIAKHTHDESGDSASSMEHFRAVIESIDISAIPYRV